MKRNYKIDGVDMVTFPGADGIFSSNRSGEIELIKRSVSISVEKHGSRVLAVVGHYDCAGSPGASLFACAECDVCSIVVEFPRTSCWTICQRQTTNRGSKMTILYLNGILVAPSCCAVEGLQPAVDVFR